MLALGLAPSIRSRSAEYVLPSEYHICPSTMVLLGILSISRTVNRDCPSMQFLLRILGSFVTKIAR